MTKFTPIGMLGVDDEGQFRWVPIQLSVSSPSVASKTAGQGVGRIIKPPTPEEDKIAKENVPDLSVDGILNKRKSEEEPQ